jgi:hypothetical protein
MKSAVLQNVMPCNFVHRYHGFGRAVLTGTLLICPVNKQNNVLVQYEHWMERCIHMFPEVCDKVSNIVHLKYLFLLGSLDLSTFI